jgi:hypothetical protein
MSFYKIPVFCTISGFILDERGAQPAAVGDGGQAADGEQRAAAGPSEGADACPRGEEQPQHRATPDQEEARGARQPEGKPSDFLKSFKHDRGENFIKISEENSRNKLPV